jgi:menaquinone-specific isochorismate synthase
MTYAQATDRAMREALPRHGRRIPGLRPVSAASTTPGADRLAVTTARLAGEGTGVRGAAVDLLAAAGRDGILWQHEGSGLAGRGVALRIELPRGLTDAAAVAGVTSSLAAIRRSDDVAGPGTGAVALGALPFAREAPGTLVVPRVVIGRRDGEAWITTVAGPGDGPSAARLAGQMAADALGGFTDPRPAPSEFTLTAMMDHDAWGGLVAGAVARIDAGALGKVVLARQVDVTANRPFVTSDVLARLLALYPTCMIFRIDGFLGASPELLIERRGALVASHPLAGTIGRSGDLATDEALIAGLLASPKERSEHAYVIEGLRRTLGPLCDDLEVPDKPTVLELRNVTHLATRLSGVLSAAAGGRSAPDGPAVPGGPAAPDGGQGATGHGGGHPAPSAAGPAHPGLRVPSALQLVAAVHPTPAVGGTPTDAAVAYISEVEGFDRGRYAGPVGWMDARGDGSWAIGLRSADVDGPHASMYAGVGVVAGSRAGTELAETQLKLQALLAALVRP